MQPLAELTWTRPWHWGVAVLGDPVAEAPTSLGGQLVVIGQGVVALRVRHAQDIEADQLEGDREWATATFHVRSLAQEEPTQRRALADVVISTPAEVVSLGDADGMVSIPAPGVPTRVMVTTEEVDPAGMERIWVDLIAVE